MNTPEKDHRTVDAHIRAFSCILEDNPRLSRDYATGWVDGRWSGETRLIAKNVGLKKLLFEAVKFIEADLEGLRAGISVNGRLSGLAEDADTVKEIRAIELWLVQAEIELGRVE